MHRVPWPVAVQCRRPQVHCALGEEAKEIEGDDRGVVATQIARRSRSEGGAEGVGSASRAFGVRISGGARR